MKFRKSYIVCLLIISSLLTQCKDINKSWLGKYEGTIPCADCEGIKTEITLKKDNTFRMEQHYLGGKVDRGRIFTAMGKFKWDASDSLLTFQNKSKKKFKVVPGKLIWLDVEGKKIKGDLAGKFELRKIEGQKAQKKSK